MMPITVFCEWTSPRLIYVLDWIFRDVLQAAYRMTDREEEIDSHSFFIAYGKTLPGALYIPDAGLLSSKGIREQDISFGAWQDIPTLFHSDNTAGIPFDLFSAVFFLLSRYEEYYPYTPDKHGRYPAEQSILFQKGWLRRPLADEWLYAFARILISKGITISLTPLTYQATYDIDIAWSYRHKDWKRGAGAFLKDILKGNRIAVRERLNVLSDKAADPFDCFAWLHQLHQANNIQPVYFILAALRTTAFDKNNPPEQPAMQQLIKNLAAEGMTGMHPSYYSTDDRVFAAEKKLLERTTGKAIHHSRQHYLRFNLPATYEALLQRGITDDYSMGYGAYLGFRAGTGRSFKWYHLQKEQEEALTIHPFCFMDSTAHFEERLNASEAFTALASMQSILQQTGSRLTTVFHNFSLGTDPQWKGWREAYEQFVQQMAEEH